MSLSDSECWSVNLTLPSVRGAGKDFINNLLEELRRNAWNDHEVFGVHLAVEEAVVNAIKHGNCLDESKQVQICCRLWKDRLWIEIIDEGCGFNPDEVPDCTQIENLEIPNGRGIMLMRSFMSKVEYSSAGNGVILEKLRGQS
ncbi:MAG: ATP-binding protein [Planctomycetota bacterium]|nr:ATP-binding protein [Planctomycetota bacterium]